MLVLYENGPHRLMYFNVGSQLVNCLGNIRSCDFTEEVCHWGAGLLSLSLCLGFMEHKLSATATVPCLLPAMLPIVMVMGSSEAVSMAPIQCFLL